MLLSGLLLTALCLALLPLNRIDFDRMDFVDEDSVTHAYYELVSEHIDRGPLLTYGVVATQAGGIARPALLHELDHLAGTLRQWPEITGVASLVELVRAVNAALPDAGSGRGGQGRIPDSAEAVQQHLSDYRVAQNQSYPLSDFVDANQRVTRFFVNTARLSNRELVSLDQRLRQAFDETVNEARLLQGSSTLLFARMDDTVTGELLRGYALTLAIITLTLMIGLRSIRFGLISLLPNVMPAVIVFGLRGLFNAQIDPFILMLFSVSVGLVVDDTVHILSTWLRARRSGADAEQAMDTAVFRAGPALLITTLVLCLGTLMLLGASTLYFQQAARLLVPIVLLALVLDLTFLPSLLRRMESSSAPEARPAQS
jgi:predicted RND superfamily exporter protein